MLQEQVFGFNESKLQELIQLSIRAELSKIFSPQQVLPKEEKEVVLRTREYVKDFFHTTYPTLRKFNEQGLLKPIYFGRKVLYRDDDLLSALPTISAITPKRKSKKAS